MLLRTCGCRLIVENVASPATQLHSRIYAEGLEDTTILELASWKIENLGEVENFKKFEISIPANNTNIYGFGNRRHKGITLLTLSKSERSRYIKFARVKKLLFLYWFCYLANNRQTGRKIETSCVATRRSSFIRASILSARSRVSRDPVRVYVATRGNEIYEGFALNALLVDVSLCTLIRMCIAAECVADNIKIFFLSVETG